MDATAEYIKQIFQQSRPVVEECGAFIRSHFGKVGLAQADAKSLNSLVSFVDVETEKMLVSAFSDILPDSDFITEEKTVCNSSSANFTWIIDPLDGTTNFLRGIPVFSISIALTYRDEIVLGIIYDVVQQNLYHAIKDQGAFMNDQKISVAQTTSFDRAMVATGFPYEAYHSFSPMFEVLKNIIRDARGIRRLGSAAMDLAYVAKGVFDGYYEASLNPWDVAAGIILVREAGGKVSSFDGKDLSLQNGSILAANPNMYEELYQRLQSASAKVE